jgi:hypothetical protein
MDPTHIPLEPPISRNRPRSRPKPRSRLPFTSSPNRTDAAPMSLLFCVGLRNPRVRAETHARTNYVYVVGTPHITPRVSTCGAPFPPLPPHILHTWTSRLRSVRSQSASSSTFVSPCPFLAGPHRPKEPTLTRGSLYGPRRTLHARFLGGAPSICSIPLYSGACVHPSRSTVKGKALPPAAASSAASSARSQWAGGFSPHAGCLSALPLLGRVPPSPLSGTRRRASVAVTTPVPRARRERLPVPLLDGNSNDPPHRALGS